MEREDRGSETVTDRGESFTTDVTATPRSPSLVYAGRSSRGRSLRVASHKRERSPLWYGPAANTRSLFRAGTKSIMSSSRFTYAPGMTNARKHPNPVTFIPSALAASAWPASWTMRLTAAAANRYHACSIGRLIPGRSGVSCPAAMMEGDAALAASVSIASVDVAEDDAVVAGIPAAAAVEENSTWPVRSSIPSIAETLAKRFAKRTRMESTRPAAPATAPTE